MSAAHATNKCDSTIDSLSLCQLHSLATPRLHKSTFTWSDWRLTKYHYTVINQVDSFRYGVATISRLLQIIGLFCKRVLEKRRYSSKSRLILRSLQLVATHSTLNPPFSALRGFRKCETKAPKGYQIPSHLVSEHESPNMGRSKPEFSQNLDLCLSEGR